LVFSAKANIADATRKATDASSIFKADLSLAAPFVFLLTTVSSFSISVITAPKSITEFANSAWVATIVGLALHCDCVLNLLMKWFVLYLISISYASPQPLSLRRGE
jgi:hypothetical protein